MANVDARQTQEKATPVNTGIRTPDRSELAKSVSSVLAETFSRPKGCIGTRSARCSTGSTS